MKTQETKMQPGSADETRTTRCSAITRIIGTVVLLLGTMLVCSTPVDAASLYALVDTGELYFSEDQGANWALRAALPCRDAVALAARETADDLYLATATGALHSSLNAGEDWIWQGAVPASDVCAMVIREDGAILLLTETGSVWESMDGGAQFTALGSITASDLTSLTHTANGELCAVTRTGTVAVSSDQGATWEMRGAISASDLVEIVLAGSDLVALTCSGSIWKSIDEGVSWLPIGTVSQVHMTSVVSDDTGVLFAAVREGEIASSADGTEWTWVGTTNQLNVVALAIDSPSSSVTPSVHAAAAFRIAAAWPNPMHGCDRDLNLRLSSARNSEVVLSLHDSEGRCIHVGATHALHGTDDQHLSWHLGDLATGVYYAQLAAAGSSERASTRIVVMQ